MEGMVLGNRYELIERIGGGGMAVVYKAKCRLLNRYVAVKVLRPEFTNDEEFIKRFGVEAQSAASLSSHPNIVAIFDVGNEDNLHYIVMEYVNGITLKEYIGNNGPLKWRQAVDFATQISSAIDHAHSFKIVHRDIKPHNILITKDGTAKVTDFGIARAVTSSTITMAGNTIGSVHYFSPEQARGGYTDEKSDLYSLGITLYEMVTGKLPFDGESPVTIALKHIQDEPVPPLSLVPDLPPAVNDIIMKAIRKSQSARYQTAGEMHADLKKVLLEPGIRLANDDDFKNDSSTSTIVMKAVTAGSLSEKGEGLEGQKGGINLKSGNSRKNGDNDNGTRKHGLTIALAVITSLVIISAFVYLVISLMSPPANTLKKDFEVKDYIGRNYYEVRDELEKEGIVAKDIRVFNYLYEKDIIAEQGVAPGKTMKAGGLSTLEFTVSKGPEMYRLPDFKGKDYREAQIAMEDEGLLIVTVIDEFSSKIETGLVTRTEPQAREEVAKGSEIMLFRSKGPETGMTVVPDLVNKRNDDALKELAIAKLILGNTYPGQGSSSSKVIRQEPAAGSEVKEGTAVDLYYDTIIATATPAASTQMVTRTHAVSLLAPDMYDNKIRVVAKATYSTTNETEIIIDDEYKKESFPLYITIKIPLNGKTHLVVTLDGKEVLNITDNP